VAEGKAIYLSNSFIDSFPDSWFELTSGRARPVAGLHFGSLLVGQSSGQRRPTEYISPSRVNMITNRGAFLGMYLLDIWANHQDNRQAVLRRGSNDHTQEAFFIDHGHMFGGLEWDFKECPGVAFHLETAVYSDLWEDEQIASWISHFRTVIPEVLSWVEAIVPLQWYKGDLSRLIDRLTERLSGLNELIQADAAKSRLLAPQKSDDDTLRLSDSGIHGVRASDARDTPDPDTATACA
jgi:hypothetical protein